MQSNRESYLPHERLDAYRVALELISVLVPILERKPPPHLRDQLQRASTSIALNIAEGCGRAGKDRLNFYRIARGSSCEVAAVLDALDASGFAVGEAHATAHQLCARLYAMLTRLAGL